MKFNVYALSQSACHLWVLNLTSFWPLTWNVSKPTFLNSSIQLSFSLSQNIKFWSIMLKEKTSSRTSILPSVGSNLDYKNKKMNYSKKTWMIPMMSYTTIMSSIWYLFKNLLWSDWLRRMNNRLLKEYKCMRELLLKLFRKKLSSKLWLSLSCRKINKNCKKSMKITSLMWFIRKYNSRSVRQSVLQINTLQF